MWRIHCYVRIFNRKLRGRVGKLTARCFLHAVANTILGIYFGISAWPAIRMNYRRQCMVAGADGRVYWPGLWRIAGGLYGSSVGRRL